MAEGKGYIKNSDDKGSVNISEDVVAVIAAAAAVEVEGVHGPFVSHGKEITNMLGRRALSRGVKLHIEGDVVTVDVHLIAEMGYSVNDVGMHVQKAVITAIEDAVGVTVSAVNVHICGIASKKNK